MHTRAGPVSLRHDPAAGLVPASIPHDAHEHPATTWHRLLPTHHAADVFAAVRAGAGPSPVVALHEGWAPSFVGVMYYRVLEDAGDVVRLRVRMVAIGLEDPACGSGSSALCVCVCVCAWLALQRGKGRGGARVRFELEEGTEIGRQSFIGVELVLNRRGDGVQEVWLMGKAAWVTKGEFFGV